MALAVDPQPRPLTWSSTDRTREPPAQAAAASHEVEPSTQIATPVRDADRQRASRELALASDEKRALLVQTQPAQAAPAPAGPVVRGFLAQAAAPAPAAQMQPAQAAPAGLVRGLVAPAPAPAPAAQMQPAQAAPAGRVPGLVAPAPAAQPAANAEPFGRAASGAVRLSPNDLGVIPQDQGDTNACGTTSLANVMTHFGTPMTHQQIDRNIRAFDIFTAPDRIAGFARANRMSASVKPEASLNDLTNMIDRGVPPIVLYDPDGGDNSVLHYATVTGYNRGADGQVSNVILANSSGAQRQTMPAAEFMQRWTDVKMQGRNIGMSRMMISVVPNDNRNITGGDGLIRRASSIALPTGTLVADLRSTPTRLAAQTISDAAVTARAAHDGAVNVVTPAARVAHAARGGVVGVAAGVVVGGQAMWRALWR